MSAARCSRGHVGGEPRGDAVDVLDVVGPGPGVALRPTGDLALDVAGGLSQIAQAGGFVVEPVKRREVVDQRLVQAAHLIRRERETGRQVLAQDHAADPPHDVEVRAEHAVVLAERERLRRERIHGVEPGQDAVLPTHVVRALHLAAERRAAQHVLALAGAQQIRQVRVPARELLDRDLVVGTDLGDVRAEVRGKRLEVEPLALADAPRSIDMLAHAPEATTLSGRSTGRDPAGATRR